MQAQEIDNRTASGDQERAKTPMNSKFDFNQIKEDKILEKLRGAELALE